MARVKGTTTFRAALPLALALIATSVPTVSSADALASDDARSAYDRGAAAHARGDYRAAASEMARADALAPNLVALKAALDEALLADDPELGMQLVERSRARARGDATIAPSVNDAIARFAARTGRVRVDCTGRPCRVSIDARPVDLAAPAIVLAGPHRVAIDVGGAVTTKDIVVPGTHEVDVVLPPPPPPATPPPPPPTPVATQHPTEDSKGLSPAWFVTALGATAVAGGLAIASGIDTVNQHNSFVEKGCGSSGADPGCSTIANDGRYAQIRTNVIASVAGVLGVTAITLAFFVTWRSPTPLKTASLVVGDRSAAFRLLF